MSRGSHELAVLGLLADARAAGARRAAARDAAMARLGDAARSTLERVFAVATRMSHASGKPIAYHISAARLYVLGAVAS